ncbi:MAG: hypothetical protein AAGD35_20720 [Actinomycetota bacterium]
MTSFAATPVAVVDIGSVSCQMLMTDGRTRLRRSVDTLLGGATMGANGKVAPRPFDAGALAHTEEVLVGYAAAASDAGASTVRVVGTASARRAPNASDLAALVERTMGAPLEILDGEDEGRLAFTGAMGTLAGAVGEGGGEATAALVAVDDPVLTVDIGGGSTEFTLGSLDRGPTDSISIPLGGALVTAAYLHGDPPGPDELSAALSVVELHLDDVRRELPALTPALASINVVGLGAAVTLAAIEIGLADADPHNGDGDGPLHRFELTREALEDVFRTIATEDRDDRAHNPGLPPSRVHDIVGACAVLVETMRQFDLDAVTISQRGLADGVASEMLAGVG